VSSTKFGPTHRFQTLAPKFQEWARDLAGQPERQIVGSYGICHSIVAAEDTAPFMYAIGLKQPNVRPTPAATERNGSDRPPHRPLLGFTPERAISLLGMDWHSSKSRALLQGLGAAEARFLGAAHA
jgi:hypothetical protein